MNAVATIPAAIRRPRIGEGVAPSRTLRRMRAAVVNAPGSVIIAKTTIPEPGRNQVLVHVEGCGVCASNIPPWEGKPWFSYPMPAGAPGHEGWGTIEDAGGAVRNLKRGERVVFLSCNAYADYDVCDSSAVVKLPDTFDQQPFPGEPLGCVMNIFERSRIAKDDRVAIVGVGFLGALLTQLASATGAQVIALSRRKFALGVAKEMGAIHAVPLDDQSTKTVQDLTSGRFCDVVIECTGKQLPLHAAGEITRERGRLVIAGYHQEGPRQINMQLWNWRGLDVINAHERDSRVYVEGIRRAIRAIEAGLLNPAPLYTHSFPLKGLGDALNMVIRRPDGFMKALIKT